MLNVFAYRVTRDGTGDSLEQIYRKKKKHFTFSQDEKGSRKQSFLLSDQKRIFFFFNPRIRNLRILFVSETFDLIFWYSEDFTEVFPI